MMASVVKTDAVTLVTVTYGSRTRFLCPVLDAAKEQGVVEAIVIDNGSTDPIYNILSERYGAWAYIHTMNGNTGSAQGFKAGISVALERGGQFLLLLDDDNLLEPGCVASLLRAFNLKAGSSDHELLAVFAFRTGRHEMIAQKSLQAQPLKARSTFRNFHVIDIPSKILSRLPYLRASKDSGKIELVPVTHGPYGGMLFFRTLTTRVGLPNGDFVLYEDDTEFTHRIFKAGGELAIVTDAEISDLDKSWSTNDRSKTSFSIWLTGDSDVRAFYAFRNGVYSDLYCLGGKRITVILNMLVYMFFLTFLGLLRCRSHRLFLLWKALRLGASRQLGISPAFPL